ncbi:PAS domain-containing sensor histidine kinase [Halogranum rubrum]|uniref:histidine kinase n=1 Tax=Halogranum salarium B-1 TaxID=1210908 RepID=J3JFT6_9EURY|nr:PAS domain-containing sensor histidine kinase [Halogranum salarium]EJN59506.1 hypothetical protein HSB1_16640 [Halogranum salarium B-1]
MTPGRDKHAQDELSAELLEQVLDTSPVNIVVVDPSGTITLVNGRTASSFENETSTVIGESVFAPKWELTDPNGEPIAPEDHPVSRALNGEETYGMRLAVTLPSGERPVVRTNTAPIYDEEGNVVYAVATLEDITDMNRRQRELAAKNRQLESLASVLSHDLRNPLAIARGYTDLAQETGDLSLLEKVEIAHDRMEELVDNLLLLARRGHAIGPKEPVALVTSAYAAWESVETGEASFDVGTDLETVIADRVRLQQLFENLIRNAVEHGTTSTQTGRGEVADTVDHGDDEASVTITVRPLTATEGFSVEDDGPGIPGLTTPRELAEYIDRSDDTKGLGLKIVHAIADAHGWTTTIGPGSDGGLRFEFDVSEAPDDD